MTAPFPQRFAHHLIPHPITPCEIVRSITVEVERRAEGAAEGLHIRYRLLGACRTWSAESENGTQRGQVLQHSQAHSPAMGQEDCEKWTAAAHLQPATSKSDRLLGQVPQLRLPSPAREPGPRDGLWQHTCFEAFLNQPGQSAYVEFNFSPSGHWAVYPFSDERVRDAAPENMPAPRISLVHAESEIILDARLPLPPEMVPNVNLRIGLTAVIEAQDGRLTYWALHHPAERPDFHHKDGWTALLTTT